jgi:hypothetical protein
MGVAIIAVLGDDDREAVGKLRERVGTEFRVRRQQSIGC